MKRKSEKKKQKEEITALLRRLTIKNDGEKCLRCGKTERLQLSHIYPKGRYRKLELEPRNVIMLCFACHLGWWHKNPIEAKEWLDTAFTKDRLAWLKMASLDSTPYRPDYKLLKIWFEKHL